VKCHEAASLLSARLDRELEPALAAPLSDHVAGCPACRARAAGLESLSRVLQRLPYHAAPDALRSAIVRPRRGPRVVRTLVALAATLTLAVSLGGGSAALRFVRTRRAAQVVSVLSGAAVRAHVRALAAQRLVEVESSDRHTVKPWFQGKLDFSPPVRDLSAPGFPLAGGRVEILDGRRVAALVYRRRLHVIQVFVWPSEDGDAPPGARRIRGFNVRNWTRDDMTFWAVSDLADDELAGFERALNDR
jgi:anti-sigma factor RsiW